MKKLLGWMSTGITLLALATSAQADIIVNGGFESTTNGPGLQFDLSTQATGWTSTNGSGDAYNFIFAPGTADTTGATGQYGALTLWGPNDGSNNGLTPTSPAGGNFVAADGDFQNGTISQTLTGLTPSAEYDVTFWWAAAQQSGFYGATQQYWQVGFGSQTQNTPTYDLPSQGFSGWMQQTFTFTADNTTDVLSFLAVGNLPVPPFLLLDGVSVDPTPEPGSLGLILGGLMVGVGMIKSRKRLKR